ncbi:MAG: UDP-N-acetylmuramate dehydrogenase [Eubacteriales bacterium]|nr:UDP-N-acetylmuramate dehydrogenase [Eubacteriales bacterium]
MKNLDVLQKLKRIFDESQIMIDEPMKNHTTFKIGGKADFLVQPSSEEQISRLVKEIKDVPIFVMGNGSNLLVSDKGIAGIVVKICRLMSRVFVDGDVLKCQSGALLSAIAATALKNSLGGFEFAAGIPGTLGGAISMNAGAYGGEMKDVVILSRYVDENGDIITVTNHQFGYRKSVFTGTKNIITQSEIKLYKKDPAEIKALMQDLSKRRKEKQPLELCSAGSTFKRPEGCFAGKLIEEAGLKGFRIGGACVSTKHCGFVVNDADATFEDVVRLIEHIQNEVQKKFGVTLETEVKICGSL